MEDPPGWTAITVPVMAAELARISPVECSSYGGGASSAHSVSVEVLWSMVVVDRDGRERDKKKERGRRGSKISVYIRNWQS